MGNFTCPVCSKKFDSATNRKKHQGWYHARGLVCGERKPTKLDKRKIRATVKRVKQERNEAQSARVWLTEKPKGQPQPLVIRIPVELLIPVTFGEITLKEPE